MKKLFRRLKRDNSGATIIEMAFVLPIFLFMTFAIFELAIIFFYFFVMESAMYGATRFAKIQDNPQDVAEQVRERIGELSLGVMDPNKVIITTELNVNFAEDWQNSPPENCSAPNLGETCLSLPDCGGEGFEDINDNTLCDIGPPPLELSVPGAIVSFVAFYKKDIFTPGLGLFVAGGAGHFLNKNPESNEAPWYLISSATVVRNERNNND